MTTLILTYVAMGSVIGVLAGLLGIGGGLVLVPMLVFAFAAQGVPYDAIMHMALGTSAAIGFPIAIAGTVGYVYSGLHATNLPPFCLGYVYLPGLAGLVCASVLTAPLGVRLAHRLPVKRLKQVFAVLLAILGTRVLIGLM
jgi:uncharacterized protein